MAIPLDHVTATEPNTQLTKCLNCNAELTGEYCHQCGQKKVHRLEFSLKHFLGHLVHEFTHLDSNKILSTLKALLFRPGLLTAEYLAGRKGRYINPIRIYLTFSALYFLFAWGALADIRGGNVERTAHSPYAVATAKKRGLEPIVLAEKIHHRAEKFAAALRFGGVTISALFLSIFYFKTRRYYVEHLIFSLHYYSFDFLCKSLFALIFMVAGAFHIKVPVMALNLFYPVAFVYFLLALRRVYRQRWPITTVKAVALFACESALFIGVAVAGFIIAFAMA